MSLARAGVYTELPAYVQALEENDPTLGAGAEDVERLTAQQASPSHFEAERVAGPGVVFLSERTDEGWGATVDERSLQDIDVQWGNAWEIDSGTTGELDISFEQGLDDILWYMFTALAWIVAIGAVSSNGGRRRATAGTAGGDMTEPRARVAAPRIGGCIGRGWSCIRRGRRGHGGAHR